jgi:acyl-coenzyme A thioesterase PaaI-like protein
MNGNENPAPTRGRYRVEEGEWAGWHGSKDDPFNDHAGPYFHRIREDGSALCAMRVEPHHLNGGGMLHGGAIMAFADHCLYVFAGAMGDQASVTVSLHGDYLGGVPPGAVVECTGEVTRQTRSMTFLRGLMTCDRSPVFSFSGVLKRKAPRL